MKHGKKLVTFLKDEFKDLNFKEKGHVYTVGDEEMIPTSTKIKKFYEKFPLYEASLTYAENRGLKQEDVLEAWEKNRIKAAERGTDVHKFAEDYMRSGKKLKLKKSDTNFDLKLQVIKFWKEIPDYYSPLSLEQRMYSKKYKYAGTTDFLLLDHRFNSAVIGDYKTNRNIHKNYGNRMYSPFEDLIDSPYNHYQLQLSMYQILLEDIGLEITNRVVVWIKLDSYELYHPEDYTKKLRSRLKNVS